jgi:hypothetical protein
MIGDLKLIRVAKQILGNIFPSNNPHINERDYQKVMACLSNWEDRIYSGEVKYKVSEVEES